MYSLNKICIQFRSTTKISVNKILSPCEYVCYNVTVKEGYDFDELFQKAAQSRFLGGDNGRKWHASLDWLLIPSNAIKVIEGNYSPIAAAPSAPISGNPFDEYG